MRSVKIGKIVALDDGQLDRGACRQRVIVVIQRVVSFPWMEGDNAQRIYVKPLFLTYNLDEFHSFIYQFLHLYMDGGLYFNSACYGAGGGGCGAT